MDSELLHELALQIGGLDVSLFLGGPEGFTETTRARLPRQSAIPQSDG